MSPVNTEREETSACSSPSSAQGSSEGTGQDALPVPVGQAPEDSVPWPCWYLTCSVVPCRCLSPGSRASPGPQTGLGAQGEGGSHRC